MLSSQPYVCEICNYKTDIKCNYNRHIELKHSDTNKKFKCDYCDAYFLTTNNAKRHMLYNCKVKHTAQNLNVSAQNLNVYNCSKCSKEFNRVYNLKRHENKCKGKFEKYQCYICCKQFNTYQSKSQHLKLCSLNNKQTTITIPTIDTAVPDEKQLNINSNNINSNNINSNNINSNNNINIITFDTTNNTARLLFRTSHITMDEFNSILQKSLNGDIKSIEKNIFASYSRMLLENEENRCVKKTNMRGSHSHTHIGNNKWEYTHDMQVYPKFVKEIAECLNEVLLFKKKEIQLPKYIFTALDTFVNYVADYGYCNGTNEETKKVLMSYKEMLQTIKCQVFDYTKDITN